MFYVSQFYKSLFKSGGKGFSFLLLTLLLMSTYPQRGFLERLLSVSLEDQLPSPYFYAVISIPDEVDSIRGKLASLPGVEEVRLIEKSAIEDEVKTLMGDAWKDIPKDLLDLNYAGIKVVYEGKISESTRKLIRDYLIKFAGEDKVTLGPVKIDETPETKESGWYLFLKRMGLLPLFLIIFILWALSLFAFGKALSETAYIIQNFQRRSGVALKLLFWGEFSIFIMAIPLSIFWGSFTPISYIFVGIIILGLSFMIVRSPRWGDR